jgi:hypothetical protein
VGVWCRVCDSWFYFAWGEVHVLGAEIPGSRLWCSAGWMQVDWMRMLSVHPVTALRLRTASWLLQVPHLSLDLVPTLALPAGRQWEDRGRGSAWAPSIRSSLVGSELHHNAPGPRQWDGGP